MHGFDLVAKSKTLQMQNPSLCRTEYHPFLFHIISTGKLHFEDEYGMVGQLHSSHCMPFFLVSVRIVEKMPKSAAQQSTLCV